MSDRALVRYRSLLLCLAVLLDGCGGLPWRAPGAAAESGDDAPLIAAVITGVKGKAAANVRAHVSLLHERCDSAPRLQDLLADKAAEEARTALRAFGWYSPQVRVELQRTPDECPRLAIEIVPGPRVRLTEVTVGLDGPAADDAAFAAFLETLPLKADTPLNHEVYETTKTQIETWAADHGYFDGSFTAHALRVQPARQRASAELRFRSGPRYDFGELHLQQTPQVLDDALIRGFLEYTPGTPYSSAGIAAMNDALRASDYFESIDIRPQIARRADDRVPLDVTLVPRKRYDLSAGVGFSTDEALRTRFELLDRRHNARGHRILLGARASRIAQQLSAEYRVPRGHPRSEWLSLQAGLRREDVDTFDSLEAQATLSETRERPYGFIETRFVEFNRQDFGIAGRDRNTLFLIPGLRYAKTSLDHDIYPMHGYRLRAELKGASATLGSDTDIVRALVSASRITTLPWRDRVLLRADLGALWSRSFARLPPSLRFFAGGDLSVRGYGFQELGPVDRKGKVLGGRYLGVASAEYEHMFTERWGVAGFVDAGNAFGGDGRDTGIKTGIGGGLRWRSPVGPVRADLVHPLDAAAQVRLHLRVGPDL